jgi:hypothetical protein
MNVDPPQHSDGISVIADWLELVALISGDGGASLDLVQDAVDIADDTELIDISQKDVLNEELNEGISEEIIERLRSLGETAYPFRMSANGETLLIESEFSFGHYAYLCCLVINHSWASGKLVAPTKLTGAENVAARNHFETLTAVAAIGFSSGPAFLLGTNREGAVGLLARIQEICETVNEGAARPELHPEAPEAANDDGIDVIAVELEVDGPPHRNFWFCQAASGENYTDKPVINEIDRFLEIWFDLNPVRVAGAIFFPAILDEKRVRYQSRRLGHTIHRKRLPFYAERGANLFVADDNLLHFVENIDAPKIWFDEYLARVAPMSDQ